MVKNKTLLKEMFNSIKSDRRKYLSLILVIVLGVGFYIGMKNASPVLIESLSKFYEQQNFMDLEVISQMGLTDNELKEVKSRLKNIDLIEGNYRVDEIVEINSNQAVVSVKSYTNNSKINNFNLIEGSMPTSIHECVADIDLKKVGYKVGDNIVINNSLLEDSDMTISGFVTSPLFISYDKGNTNLLSGKVNYYIYVLEENFQLDYYTNAVIKLKDEHSTFSTKYNKQVNDIKNDIIKSSKGISNKRFKTTIAEYKTEIDNMENDYKISYNTSKQQLDMAEDEIEKYEKQINDGYKNIKSKQEIDSYLNGLKNQLDTAKIELDSNKKKLDDLKLAYDQTFNTINTEILALEAKRTILVNQITNNNNRIVKYQAKIEELKIEYEESGTVGKRIIENSIKSYTSLIINNQNEIIEYKQELAQLDAQIAAAKLKKNYPSYIVDAENSYNSNNSQYQQKYNEYIHTKNTIYTQMDNEKINLDKQKVQLDNKKLALVEETTRTTKKFEDARNKIDSYKDKMLTLKNSDWHVSTRYDNSGYSQYYDDVSGVKNLGEIFPIFFYLVAALITLTSISRMLDMERTQIGTLLAIGYKPKQIINKYIMYSLSIAIIGTFIGTLIGSTIIPVAIYKIYSFIYILPKISLQLNLVNILVAFILSLLSTVLISYIMSKKIFKEMPCRLMKTKPPIYGKRTLLEKFPFIWNRLKFTQKITARSIFRYKKRLIMTIFGIAGCTSLIISGLSLKSSIASTIPTQYGEVFDVNVQLLYKDSVDRATILSESERVSNLDIVSGVSLFHMESVNIKRSYKTYNVNLIVPNNNEEFTKYIKLQKKSNKEVIKLDEEGVVISEKIAKLLELKIGDYVEYTDSSNTPNKVKIRAITENYIDHYIYMDKQTYESINKIFPRNNMLLVKANQSYEASAFAKQLNDNNLFSSMLFSDIAQIFYEEILKNLNMIVLIIIASAGVLNFVVLYNLSVINISERRVELATLKVLGFRKKEINSYIKNELMILIGIGIIFGIFAGYLLSKLIIKTCEIDSLMFNNKVLVNNYIIAIILTLIFSLLIDKVINKYIKNVNITESLKSID